MPVLTLSQLTRLSNIFDNAGQVTLGSLVVSPLLGFEITHQHTALVVAGIVITAMLWGLALKLEEIHYEYSGT